MTERIAKIERKTNETQIAVELNIDGSGQAEIKTGVGFMDHMLDLFIKHGGFNIYPLQINVFSNATSKVEATVYAQNVLDHYVGSRWSTIINNYKRAIGA